MSSVGLASLSAELLLWILQSLSSLRDLRSAIIAFRDFYRIFTSYEHTIISSVLQCAIRPAVHSDAVAALDFQDITARIETGHKIESVLEKGTKLIKRLESERGDPLFEALSDRATLRKMSQLYSVVEDFIAEYCGRALSQLKKSYESPKLSTNYPQMLSPVELARLQRAFFRFEIYVRLFHIAQVRLDEWGRLSEEEPARIFLSRFSPWELEEIACVAQFLTAKVSEMFGKVEDDFVAEVLEKVAPYESQTAHVAVTSSTVDNAQSPESTCRSDDGLKMLDWFCLNFFETSHRRLRQSGHIDFLVSRGLLFVRKLSSMEPKTLRKCVLDSDYKSHSKLRLARTFAYLEFQGGSFELERQAKDSGHKIPFTGDTLDDRNLGWSWAFDFEPSTWVNAPANLDLRSQGYVFWDEGRLESLGIPRRPRALNGNLSDFPPGYREQSELPSVEERLRHVKVPGKVIEEVYDGTFHPDSYSDDE